MSHVEALSSWKLEMTSRFPQLSKPQATVLALWSFGMVMTGSCGLTTVSYFLAALLGRKENTLRQRLREWYRSKDDKKGEKRCEIEVASCFAPLFKWVLSLWPAHEKRLALALDATTLGQRFTVLAICVLCRSCSIPVAWVVLPATEKNSWKLHWLSLLKQLHEVVPEDWTVIVCADRGLYAKWLYDAICDLKWHPFLRINRQGTYRPNNEDRFRPLSRLITRHGSSWSGYVTCFKTNPLKCTLLSIWEEGYDEPWLILTDLPVEQANVCWYGLRAWIECGFKHTKRSGWQWQNTRMSDSKRATLKWLALAVATLWVVSVGSEVEVNQPASGISELPPTHLARRWRKNKAQERTLSCFRRGILAIRAALLSGQLLPMGSLYPEAWPKKLAQILYFKSKRTFFPPRVLALAA